jgi:hypothetical protein
MADATLLFPLLFGPKQKLMAGVRSPLNFVGFFRITKGGRGAIRKFLEKGWGRAGGREKKGF